jgi:hypothetical protein
MTWSEINVTDVMENISYFCTVIHAEIVTRVAGSLEAVGLPGYPEVLFVEINVMKSCQSFVALYFYMNMEDARS